MESKKVTRQDIEILARNDATVHAALMFVRLGELTFEQAMMELVVLLAEEKKLILNEKIEQYQNRI